MTKPYSDRRSFLQHLIPERLLHTGARPRLGATSETQTGDSRLLGAHTAVGDGSTAEGRQRTRVGVTGTVGAGPVPRDLGEAGTMG